MHTRKLWLFTLLIAVIGILGGCSFGKGAPANTTSQRDKNVKQGGQLIYGSIQEPTTLIPYLSDMLSAVEVDNLIFSGLVSMNNKMEWQPDLAETVPTASNGGVSNDGLTVIYRLRQGIKWHDGREVTSGDVKFTWQFIMNGKNAVVSRQGYDKLASIDIPDSRTVVLHFREPYSAYLTLFPAILPQHILEQEKDITKAAFHRAPVGTGPYQFKSWQLADAITLEANHHYYRGKPKLDKVVYKILPDTNIMLTQLKAGAVDVISNVNVAQLEQVKAISGMRVVITPGLVWERLDFNLDNPLFQDIKIRQAIALALDRQQIVNTTLKGTAVVATADQPPNSWAYKSGLQPFTRDLNTAKNLLTEAGWKPGSDGILVKEGTRFVVYIASPTSTRTRENIQLAIKQQLREIGVEAVFTNYTPELFAGDILRLRKFDMALYGYVISPDPDNVNLWNSMRIPGRGNVFEGHNYPGWKNLEVDAMTAIGARAFEPDQRKNAYARVQELIIQELPTVPLYYRGNIDVVKEKVVNFKPSPIPAGNLWNAWEWAIQE